MGVLVNPAPAVSGPAPGVTRQPIFEGRRPGLGCEEVGVGGLGCVSAVSDPRERCPQVLGDMTWGGRRQGSSFSLEPRTGCSLADHLMLVPWDLCWLLDPRNDE